MGKSVGNSQQVNVDLQRERQKATISSEEFAEWWNGGREALKEKRKMEEYFFNDPELKDPIPVSYLSHKEIYEHTMKKGSKLIEKLRKYDAEQVKNKAIEMTPMEKVYKVRGQLSGHIGMALLPLGYPLRLHFTMFLPTILNQATEEQKALWADKALNLDGMVGTYAQTEMGHGTFIRGLETRADYDVEKEEFVLNTPHLTSYKWWPGGLGHAANVAVVMAQLYIKGKHYGLQPFLVRIRDEKMHRPIMGVEVGEIGSKLGFNGVNNGYLSLKNVRIPRMHMLMNVNKVLADGTFVKGKIPLLTYGTMVFVRVNIVRDMGFYLSQAATIATRYSAVRRQSPIDPNEPEPQIIDHVTQQAKLFPEIAKSIFLTMVGNYLWNMYESVTKELQAGNQKNLPEIHALSCGLKAYATYTANDGVENLRKACGGQGFLTSSNFPSLYSNVTPAITYEGENTVMYLQTARYLIKCFVEGIKRRYLAPTVAYLRGSGRPVWSDNLKSLIVILEFIALNKVRVAFDYRALKKSQMPVRIEEVANNESGLKFVQAAEAHIKAFIARIAYESTQKAIRTVSPAIATVLQQLLEIFILDIFLTSLGDILRFYPISGAKIDKLEERYQRAMSDFRPNAIAVVDGFDFHDRLLSSTLGSYDGRVYERLMEEAKKSPLNQQEVNQTFQTHLKPFLRSQL